MKWNNIKLIFLRELKDQLRDRRTLFTIAVLPMLLYPLLGFSFFQVIQFTRENPSKILVVGADRLPDRPVFLVEGKDGQRIDPILCNDAAESELLKLTVSPADKRTRAEVRTWAEELVQQREYDAVIYFPPKFGESLDAFSKDLQKLVGSSTREDSATPSEELNQEELKSAVPSPDVIANHADDRSRIASDRLTNVLRRWRADVVQRNLREIHVPAATLEPFAVSRVDIAEETGHQAAIWSKILPFVVLIWALTGAFYPAIDLCAGEKERGTLETLLSSPAARSEIVWGKLLTVITFSMTTAILNLASMGLTGTLIMNQIAASAPSTAFNVGPPPLLAVVWLVIALFPISALFSALSLAIASFARSTKEGQYYLMPLLLISLPLMTLPMLPSANLDLGVALIPITGLMLLLRSLIEGQYAQSLPYVLPVAGVTLVCCLLAIRWAIEQFTNESVLFRESERWDLKIWVKHLVRDRGMTPTIGEAVLCGILLLVIRFFGSLMIQQPVGWNQFAVVQVVTQIAFILTPVLLMTIMLTRSPRETLSLNIPPLLSLPLAGALALLLHPAALTFNGWIRELYPMGTETKLALEGLQPMLEGAPILMLLLVFAVVPAICEEIAFRGFILSGLRHMGHKWGAIILSSLFFGVTHTILQQSVAAAVVGVVIGYLVVQSGSILTGIMFHLVYNSTTFLVTRYAQVIEDNPVGRWLVEIDGGEFSYTWAATAIGFVLAIGILTWFRTLPEKLYEEEKLRRALDHPPAGVFAR